MKKILLALALVAVILIPSHADQAALWLGGDPPPVAGSGGPVALFVGGPVQTHIAFNHRNIIPGDEYVTIGSGPTGHYIDMELGREGSDGAMVGLSVQPAVKLIADAPLFAAAGYFRQNVVSDGTPRTLEYIHGVRIDDPINADGLVDVKHAINLEVHRAYIGSESNWGIRNWGGLWQIDPSRFDSLADFRSGVRSTYANLNDSAAYVSIGPQVATNGRIRWGHGSGTMLYGLNGNTGGNIGILDWGNTTFNTLYVGDMGNSGTRINSGGEVQLNGTETKIPHLAAPIGTVRFVCVDDQGHIFSQAAVCS